MSDREEIKPSAEQTNWAVWPMRQPHSNTKPAPAVDTPTNPPMLAARVAMAMAMAKAQGGGAAPAVGGAVF